MPSNIEIKARVADLNRLRILAEGLSDAPARYIEQHDTYFNCPNGRLKLRQIKGQTAQLIFYSRPDSSAPHRSDYTISEIPCPDRILAILAGALGIRATVVKTRTLFMVGQTRIHLDSVEGLGFFAELEVVLQDFQSAEEGHAIARKLMVLLEISEGDLLAGSYADLLNESKNLRTIERPQQERGDSTTGSAIVVCLCGSSRWPELHHRAMMEETP
ncbi:MAG: class IV adenylate cyclase [Verrucomicrobiota bacterium]